MQSHGLLSTATLLVGLSLSLFSGYNHYKMSLDGASRREHNKSES